VATSAIFSALALASIGVLFAAISHARGPRFSFLAICWLPLAGLILSVGAHHHLGYAMIGVLAAIAAVSIATVGLGVYLCVKSIREASRLRALIWGTMIAAAPLIILLLRW
jgi:hypothetical protein